VITSNRTVAASTNSGSARFRAYASSATIRRNGLWRGADFALTLIWTVSRWSPIILSTGRADRLVLNEGFFFFDKGRKLKIEQVERQ
jgi:hypothetical protein